MGTPLIPSMLRFTVIACLCAVSLGVVTPYPTPTPRGMYGFAGPEPTPSPPAPTFTPTPAPTIIDREPVVGVTYTTLAACTAAMQNRWLAGKAQGYVFNWCRQSGEVKFKRVSCNCKCLVNSLCNRRRLGDSLEPDWIVGIEEEYRGAMQTLPHRYEWSFADEEN